MAKQDDGNKGPRKTPSAKRNIDYSKATRVKEVPKSEEGWVEGKDPISGKKMWYRERGTEPRDIPGHPGTPPQPKTTISAPKLRPRPVTPTPGTPGKLPEKKPDTYKQEVVYMDDEFVTPEKVAAQSDVAGRSEYQENLGFYNPDFREMQFSEAGTGGMSKATKMYVDRKTGLPLQGEPTGFYDASGKYSPKYSSDKPYNQNVPKSAISLAPGPEVNKSSVEEILSNTKNPVTRVGTKQEMTAPLINKSEQGIGIGLQDIKTLPSTELKDKTKSPYYNQYQSEDKITSPKFKDGGYVPKSNLLRKNYLNGGDVTSKLGQSMGWMQYADMAQHTVRDSIKKDEVTDPDTGKTYSQATTQEGRVIEATAKPFHESFIENMKSGDTKRRNASLFAVATGSVGAQRNPDLVKMENGKIKFNTEAKTEGFDAAKQKEDEVRRFGTSGDRMNSRNERMEAAEGGTIVGKGGPKDDAILSKINKDGIRSGSFIVPAENNGLAKKLREKFLGGNPEKKAQFKKGGEADSDVAVSNGEHLFTPKEKQKLTAYLGKEILEKLAPNAEDNESDDMHENMTEDEHKEMMKMDMEHKANGGELSSAKARTMLHDKSANGKPLTDKQRRYFGWVAGGRKACGGAVKKAHGGDLKAPMVKYAKGTPPSGVKRVNSTGNSAADKLIDNAYINPPKDEKGWNELISKVNTLTRGTGAEFNKFRSWAEPKRESLSVKSEGEYKSNIDLVEKGPAVIKNIKKLKEIGASDDIIKRYTEQAKKYDGSSSTVKFSPDDLFDKYKTEVEDEDFKANKENVKKGLDSKVQQAYKELQDANTNPDKYTAEEIAKKQEVFDNVAMYRDKLNKGIDDNDIKAFMEGKNILSKEGRTKYPDSAKSTTAKTGIKTPDVPVTKAEAEEMARVKEQTAEAIKTGNVPTGIGPKKAPKVGVINKTGVTFTPKMTEDTGDFPVVPGTTETALDTQTIIDPRFKQKAPLSDSDAKLLVDSGKTASDSYTAPKTEEKPKWYSGLGNGLEYGASAAQIGMGLRGLNKSGKMPVDKIDPLFQSSVDKAQAAAKFGFTPEQQFSIDQDRQNAINAARFSARNFAGGNAGTAFTQERNAINQGWGMGLKAKIAGQELMQDKQRYADTLALQKAGMSRQLYEDKLAGWNQQQQAGSQLLGAGIRNMISANRYQKELEAQKQRQQYNG